MRLDYLKSDDGSVHVINARKNYATLEAGIVCVMASAQTTSRISDDNNIFIVELPPSLLSGGDRVKAFNVDLAILSHEQVQFSPAI